MRKSFKKKVIPSAVCICLLSSFSLAMAEESQEVTLDEVQVQSTVLADYQVTTEIITAEKIKEMGATNVAEAISAVPGVYVTNGPKNARMVRIRGAETDQLKVYVDGMPMFPMAGLAANASADLGSIPVENIEKIEIIKGPGPVQYGTDYKGGVIVITTKDGKGAGQGNLHLSAGSHKSFDNYISYSGSDKNASYFITAGKARGDGYLNNSNSTRDYFNGKVKWNLDKDSALTFSGYYTNVDRKIANGIDQITGQETTANIKWSGDKGVGVAPNKTYYTKDWEFKGLKQTNIALQYDKNVSKRFKYNIKVYHETDDSNMWVYNVTNAAGIPTYANPIWYRSSWDSTLNGVEFTGDWLTAKNNTLTFGAKYTENKWHDDENNSDLNEGGTDKRIGYYVQDNWKPSEKTGVSLGVRYDMVTMPYHYYKAGDAKSGNYSSSWKNTVDPVFNVTHQLDKQNTLRLSAGKTHNFVTAKQVANNLKNGDNLPNAERAVNYELGWAHNFDDNSSLDLAFFRNKITDRLIKKTNVGTSSWINVDKTNVQGVELGYKQQLSKRLKGFVNYTYLRSEDTTNGVTSKSANLPNYMVDYGFTYTVDKFQGTIMGHLNGTAQTDNTTANSLGNIYSKVDSYHTVNLNLKYHATQNTEYFLHVNNLFNAKYWETYNCPGDGINFMAGVNYKL